MTTIPIPHKGLAPEYARPGDAGADIRSPHHLSIPVGGAAIIHTRLSMAIPEGHFGMIVGRSGLGFHHGIRLSNSVGIIDAGYRGDIAIRLHNDGEKPYTVGAGDRIAQIVIVPFVTAEWIAVDRLDKTERGEGGFGSTGRAS